MSDIDDDWENFNNDDLSKEYDFVTKTNKIIDKDDDFIPKCGEIYISTQTKIAHLNQPIDLNEIFWKLPIIQYQDHKEGVIKSQMKVNSLNKDDVEMLEKKIKECDNLINVDIIHKVDNPNARKTKFKDVRKINIGLCKKDLISYRTKKKGAFYNCFVIILRLKDNDNDNIFKEYHVKIFNTGKLELPGIKNNKSLNGVLDKLIEILSPFIKDKLYIIKDNIKTVLINSNFTCNYFIDREKLSRIIKYKYNLHVLYDPCSYPGIQCKFYHNHNNSLNNGTCKCVDKCYNKKKKQLKCMEVSFMIFRTGSILIVGKCDELTLQNVYKFIKNILINDYKDFIIKGTPPIKKEKTKKIWKKQITLISDKTN
tara:strand:+ start:2403 stop:3506 length:1104 start_codon:yes stop_codon:yes gene_type:complete